MYMYSDPDRTALDQVAPGLLVIGAVLGVDKAKIIFVQVGCASIAALAELAERVMQDLLALVPTMQLICSKLLY